jgi:hypothetical protein
MRTSRSAIVRGLATVAGLVAAGLAAACTSTSLVNMWRDPGYPQQPLSRILVVTLRKDAVSRRIWEDGFVAALKRHGIDATPSYDLFPRTDPDTTDLLNAVRRRGFDGVLMAHRESATTRTTYVRGYVAVRPVWYRGPWIRHYALFYQRIYSPGYVEINRVVRYEVDVWMTAGDGRLVWSGITASLNPTSSSQVNKEIADQIVPQLLRTGIVTGR